MNPPDLYFRGAVDGIMATFGVVVALSWLRAPVLRIVAAPIAAIPVSAATAVAWSLLTTCLPRADLGLGVVGCRMMEAALCGLAGLFAGVWTPRGRLLPRVIRGTTITGRSGSSWRRARAAQLQLAGVAVPTLDESKHFKVVGTTGTGKTTAIQGLIAGALARGDKAIIADPDGTYRTVLHNPGRDDLSLNPLDCDTHQWDLFGEIEIPTDADLVARALIPDSATDDRAWRAYARLFVASLLRQSLRAGDRNVGELHRLVAWAPTAELRELLDGTAAAAYVSEDNARFFASVRAIASSDLAFLEPLAACCTGPSVAIRPWVRIAQSQSPTGVLFLPYRGNQLSTLKGLIATWLRLAIFEAMESGAAARALWFVIDELDALGPIDGLKDALVRLRKYEGRCVLGLQSISQLSGTYGPAAAQTIIENCGNTLVLRCSAGESGGTARFASMLIGDREVLRTQTSRTRPTAFGRSARSRSDSEQIQIERAVLPAEIEQLPDLHGYLKLASSRTWRRVQIER